MLTFESLLLKELQKQQSRAEFCDIVLQTQGVSVPVHSCVLSAFSPWLCGALSTMPSPRTGQKRLIEVDVGKACTLLSLVSLLYSGQFNEDKEEVLSAACKLGINIPQPDITAGSKSQESKAERAATEQKSGSQVGTQTELTKEAVGRECQTEFLCAAVPTFPSECSHPKETVETVNVIGSSSWRTDQEICTYAAASDITLTTLKDVQSIPEKLPSFQVMDVVPETSMYPTDTAPPMKRQRGRPRKRPLPLPNASQTGMSQSEQKVTNHPAPSLMHTATLPAANQTGLAQPMDWLIDDVIAQLPFIPPITSGIQNNQDGTTNTATLDSNPRTQPSVKLSDPGMVQPQPEGELTDILDSFLRTFDQHVGACDVDDQHGMPGGSQSNITDKTTNAYQQSAESYTVQTDTSNTHTGNNSWYPFRTSPMNTTPPQGLTVSLSQNRPQVSVCRSQKPSFSSEVPGVIMKKIKERPSEEKSESRRMTRSQSRKRDMKNNVDWQWREELPAKRRRNRQTQELENKGVNETKRPVRQMQSEKKGTSCKVDSCNVASALRKVMSVPSSCSIKCSTQSKKNIQKTLDRSQSSDWCGQKESCQSVTKNTLSGSHPEKALSAFELMKNLLENQRKRQEEKDHQMWTVERRRESEKMLMSKCAELTTGGKRAQTSNQTTSLKVTGQEERLIKNSYNQPTFVTVDSPSDSPFESTSESSDSNHATVDTEGVMLKDVTAMPHVSRAVDPAMLPKEPGHTQSLTDSSEEDVDIDEVSSSFTESFPVLTVSADIVPSTEEEDDEEEIEIDVLGSN